MALPAGLYCGFHPGFFAPSSPHQAVRVMVTITVSSLTFPLPSPAAAIPSLLPLQQLQSLFPFLVSAPPPHWHPPPRAPSLLPLVLASVGFSASLTLCTLWLLFVHLSVPLCACFRCSFVS